MLRISSCSVSVASTSRVVATGWQFSLPFLSRSDNLWKVRLRRSVRFLRLRVIIVVRGTDVLLWSAWPRVFRHEPAISCSFRCERVFSWARLLFPRRLVSVEKSLVSILRRRCALLRSSLFGGSTKEAFRENIRKPRVPFSLRATWLLARSCYVRTPVGLQCKIIVSPPSCCSPIST